MVRKITQVALLTALLICSNIMLGQDNASSDEEQVKTAINNMFDAMRESDSIKLKSVFHPNIEMFTSFNRNGKAVFHKGSAQEFITAVGQEKTDLWDERIDTINMKIDDNLAQVWMDYYFYLNDQFLHCGINFMMFTKTMDGWQLFHIADTRKKGECVVPGHLK